MHPLLEICASNVYSAVEVKHRGQHEYGASGRLLDKQSKVIANTLPYQYLLTVQITSLMTGKHLQSPHGICAA